MRVCNIESVDGDILFDGVRCSSAEDAYKLYRSRYNASLGKDTHSRYGHVGERTERLASTGICFDDMYRDSIVSEFGGRGKIRTYILGILGISYCKTFGEWDLDRDITDDQYDRYIDWILCEGLHNMRLYGRRQKIVRDNFKTRYNNGRKRKEA